MRGLYRRFKKDDSGATSIEYALIASFIGLSIITAASSIGVELQKPFQAVEEGFKNRPQ